MKLYCISDKESSMVFKLVNVQTFEATGREQAIDVFNKIISSPDAGIIFITDIVASLIKDEIVAFTNRNTKPLVLEVPSYTSSVKIGRNQNGTG